MDNFLIGAGEEHGVLFLVVDVLTAHIGAACSTVYCNIHILRIFGIDWTVTFDTSVNL